MEAANRAAINSLQEYEDFLDFVIKPQSNGNFAIGEDNFNFLLRESHFLDLTAEDLMNIGKDAVISTKAQLEELAAEIEPSSHWEELIKKLKQDHPGPEELLPEYSEWMNRALEFVRERDLVTIPENQELEIVETPEFQRSTIPYAAFIPPAPFEKKQQGIFWVTPVDGNAAQEEHDEQLQGHSSWGIPVTALHEAYPGHHLQLCHANKVSSITRRQMFSTVFIEGWALYCEEMMLAQGFLDKPQYRLMQLKDQLWRACRVVIDVGIHCFEMTFDEAVEMLVTIAGLERVNAVSEVNRYTQSPTQPMSYLIGKREVIHLRDSYQAKKGDDFQLKEFHDRLLSYGSIPAGIIKKDMLG